IRLQRESQRLRSICERKLELLAQLKQSILHRAFTGELTGETSAPATLPFPVVVENISATDLHAGLLAIAYRAHEAAGRLDDYGHVKGEKFAHMSEAMVGIELGRS